MERSGYRSHAGSAYGRTGGGSMAAGRGGRVLSLMVPAEVTRNSNPER